MDRIASECDAALADYRRGQPDQALARLEQLAIQLPSRARACYLQASILRDLDRHKEALIKCFESIEADPTLPDGWEIAAFLLIHHRKWTEASQMLAIAIQALPSNALIHAQYSLCLTKIGELALAYKEANQALDLQPDLPQGRIAKIEILWAAGYYDLAYKNSLLLEGNTTSGAATYSQGSSAFMIGEFAHGMKLLASVIDKDAHEVKLPLWDGQPALDQHLLLYSAQGFGDRIHFVRYIDFVRKKFKKITLLSPPALVRLIRDSFSDLPLAIEPKNGKDDITYLPSDVGVGIPDDATLCCPLTSLPDYLDGGFDPLASKVPYLRADMALSCVWNERLSRVTRPRIGLVWSSDSWYSNDPVALITFEILRPLIDAARTHIVSLQMGPKAQQAIDAGIYDSSPFIKDFADSAALIDQLDVLISLDSAPLHLAGALGKPVWMMSPFRSEWRWLIGREDSIWYPTLRLFRMEKPQDWDGVVSTLCVNLKRLLGGDTSVLQPAVWTGSPLQRNPLAIPLPGFRD
jgi:hypothetical protein